MTNWNLDLIGFVPAAGRGSRLQSYNYAKELAPIPSPRRGVSEDRTDQPDSVEPPYGADERHPHTRPVIVSSFDVLEAGGVDRALVVINESKTEIVKCLSSGAFNHLNLSYFVQQSPRGLCDAVVQARTWLSRSIVCLVLPDTIVRPVHCLQRVLPLIADEGADVAMAVFPTPTPENLGPIVFGPDHRTVERVLEKPTGVVPRNTWGVVAWQPRFTDFLVDFYHQERKEENPPELSIGHAFQRAIESGFKVQGVEFVEGAHFFDVGTPVGLQEVWEWLLPSTDNRGRRLASAG